MLSIAFLFFHMSKSSSWIISMSLIYKFRDIFVEILKFYFLEILFLEYFLSTQTWQTKTA